MMHQLTDAGARQTEVTKEKPASDTTLIFYFSGYGTTTPAIGSDSAPVRCILPYDAQISDIGGSCVSTTELTEWLRTRGWKNQIDILDTSYDTSGDYAAEGRALDKSTRSRTFGNYHSGDNGWRLMADVEDNKVALVAGGANEDALEGGLVDHGLLTASFVEALGSGEESSKAGREHDSSDQIATELRSESPMSLVDVYRSTAERTTERSAGRQHPILKGNLTTPFVFKRVTPVELINGASTEVDLEAVDTMAMRGVDENSLADAKALLVKALELASGEVVTAEDQHNQAIDQISARTGLGMVETRTAIDYIAKDRSDQAASITDHQQKASGFLVEAVRSARALLKPDLSSGDREYFKLLLQQALVATSLLDMEMGRLEAADELSTEAATLETASRIAPFVNGQVLLSEGRYAKSSGQFVRVLRMTNTAEGADKTLFTQEQLAMTLLWRVVSGYLGGDKFHKGRLRIYARNGTKTGAVLHEVFSTASALPGLHRHFDEAVAEGAIQTDATWPREVANYLLGYRSENELRAFGGADNAADIRSSMPFRCSVEFYVGFKSLVENNVDIAVQHFKKAVSTNQPQLVEYWVSKDQLAHLSSSR
jgi:uncharacterized caspase-like protein